MLHSKHQLCCQDNEFHLEAVLTTVKQKEFDAMPKPIATRHFGKIVLESDFLKNTDVSGPARKLKHKSWIDST